MLQSTAVLGSTALAHTLTTGCALLLIRRGPNRRLRLLTLTVGIMSLAQTVMLLEGAGMWRASEAYASGIHEVLVGGMSLLAIHLLRREIQDRRHTDQRLRLVEHERAMVTVAVQEGVKKEHRAANPSAVVVWSLMAEGEKEREESGQAMSPGNGAEAEPGDLELARATECGEAEDLLRLFGAIEAQAHRAHCTVAGRQ